MATEDLYNVNDGIHGRDGGPYLDQEEAKVWEIQQAKREGVEPDLENPRPYPGEVLVNRHQLVQSFVNTRTAGDDTKDDSIIDAPVRVANVPVPEPETAEDKDIDTDNTPYYPNGFENNTPSEEVSTVPEGEQPSFGLDDDADSV